MRVFALVASLRACRRKRLIDNLPTSKTQGVFIGLAELKGTVQCGEPLVSYLAGSSCVYYTYDIEERWSRMVTETESDGKGRHADRDAARERLDLGRLRNRIDAILFAGRYRQPAGPAGRRADRSARCARPDLHAVRSALLWQGSGRWHHGLGWGPPLHRVGHSGAGAALPCRPGPRTAGRRRAEIAADPKASDYLISVRSEEQVSSGLGWQIWLFFLLGAITAPGGHIAGELVLNDDITPLMIGIFIGEFLLYVLVWFVGWFITVYNSLVELRQRVEQGWGQVDIQLKRRTI